MSDSSSGQGVQNTSPSPRSRGRSATAVLCLVIAAVLTTPAAVAFWGQRTLNDSQRYLDTVGPLVHSAQVQDVIATKVTDAIQRQVDVEAILDQVFAGVITDRPRLQAMVGPLSGAIDGFIDTQVRGFIASDTFADLWVAANSKAQVTLVRLLQGNDTGAVSLQGDQVVLDLNDVIDQVKQRLVARGLTIVQNIPTPSTDKQIVLLDAPKLRQLRTIYAFANPVAQWLIVFVAALYLVALLISRRRPRMMVTIGLLLVANALLLALALAIGRQLFIDDFAGTVLGPASAVFYDTLLGYLQRGWHVLLWLGVIVVLTGWFTGSSTAGQKTRAAVRDGLEKAGAAVPGQRVGAAGRWVTANAHWLRAAAGLLGAVVLLWGNEPTTGRLLWALGLVLLLLLAVQVLIGAAGAESATDTLETVGADAG